MKDKPKLWPFVCRKLGLSTQCDLLTPPIDESAIRLDPPVENTAFMKAIREALRPQQVSQSSRERLLHCYGKSYPDLLRARRGEFRRAPDVVILPETHEDVETIVTLANRHEVCVIPFGGGTNIVGGINPEPGFTRMIVSLDMRQMNKLMTLDPVSNTATIQAGALGPKLEHDLQEKGYSLGHFPDSFEFSSLGGWIATRSAGMQSDAYGKIEDMVVSLRMVTPSGTLTTRPVPASSAGPDLNRLVTGSEGVFGVITEGTLRVHKNPPVKDYRGYLFKRFDDGVQAIQECLLSGWIPSMIRFQDTGETELAFNLKTPKTGLAAAIEAPIKRILKAKGYTEPCILVVGFEGERDVVTPTREAAIRIFKRYGAFSLGRGVGKTWSADKFNVPYLRDYVMDRGVMCDVSETAALWANVRPLYRNTIRAIKERFEREPSRTGYVGCHISHTYPTGACLYFTYAAQAEPGRELEQYYEYKRLITETFLSSGGTLSHHHAIGTEHRPWMQREVSETGLQALRALKTSLDPRGIFNPGKLIPEGNAAEKVSTVSPGMRQQATAPVDHGHERTSLSTD